MQTTLARRQRHRRINSQRPVRRGGTTLRRLIIIIPLILVLLAVLVAGTGLLFTVAAYNHYSAGLPDPKAALTDLTFEQQTRIFDRTGKIELARLGELRREVVTYDQIPGEMLDATTAVEDKDFWINPGFDPAGIVSAGLDTISGRPRGASTITQQLVRARLLPSEAFAGSTYERKVREIIQSIRLTEAYPGDDGKKQIITAYLNQNFYGNQTYGVKAAAKGYFGKDLSKLTLAQYAILAGIPQSPTKFDLMKNAQEVCMDPGSQPAPSASPEPSAGPSPAPTASRKPGSSPTPQPTASPTPEAPDLSECADVQLVVPKSSEIVQRRDYILELMKTRSTLTAGTHSAAQYDAAKDEPVILSRQVSATWKAPQFVWKVRDALARILCPDKPSDCPAVDTGGYSVTTTLDWGMQKTTEKYVYAAARIPHVKDPRAALKTRNIPTSEWSWILGLRGRNIHNAAAGVIDYRTGEVLAYVGSASYTSKGTTKFQPQFDVLSDGWRQPGSSIKPIDYLIGIQDETLTASTMFMDVVTNFGRNFVPTQADHLERGPVRLRSALQFSLNVPAIKATIISGLNHVFERTQDFGLNYQSTAGPVLSEGIGTLETHPMDLLGAYGTIANGGLRMPREVIASIRDDNGKQVWPLPNEVAKGDQVVSKQAAYIVTDILAGNTDTKINPFWGKWAITDGSRRRPAAYKTGTTNDNVDVHAYGFLAPPKDTTEPALAVGVWMGNSNNDPNNGSLSLDSSAPLWSAILSEVSKGTPIASFKAPSGLKTAVVDAFTGLKPGPFTNKTVKELFLPGTVPTQKETIRVAITVDAHTGLRWQDGCVGPKVTRGYFNLSDVESNFPAWQRASRNWASRAARGPGVRGGPKGTATAYFYSGQFRPFGSSWGAPFAPQGICPLAPPPPPPVCDPLTDPTCPVVPPPVPGNGGGTGGGNPIPTPTKPPKPPKP